MSIRSGSCLLAAQHIADALDPNATDLQILLIASIIEKAVEKDELAQASGIPELRVRMVQK